MAAPLVNFLYCKEAVACQKMLQKERKFDVKSRILLSYRHSPTYGVSQKILQENLKKSQRWKKSWKFVFIQEDHFNLTN